MIQNANEPVSRLRMLDAAERIAVAALFLYFVFNVVSDLMAHWNPFGLILLLSETSVLVFTLLRRSTTNISSSPLEWSLGFTGTTLPLLVLPSTNPIISPAIIVAMMLAGSVLQLTAKFFLRRSFGIVAANRGVKATGPYRVIRHPMYAGYILTEIGFLLGNPSAWNLTIYVLAWSVQIGRILVEERLLLQDEAYRVIVSRVPYRLVPLIF